MWCSRPSSTMLLFLLWASFNELLWVSSAVAQNNNNNGNNVGGIIIDAQGVVSVQAVLKESTAAAKKRQAKFLRENVSTELARGTTARRLSLVDLDARLAHHVRAGEELPLELKYLAGITRIDMLVIDVEQKDIAIIGPAEGFAPDKYGRMRGVTTGRSALFVEDLLVAWRTVAEQQTSVGCSIDPTPEGIVAFNQFTSQNQFATPETISTLFQAMAVKMGRQVIRVDGVPIDSHFAAIMVEADLRMKRIALGKDPSLVKGVSSQLASQRSGGGAMTRWWFTPLYDPLQVDAEKTLYLLSGPRLQLLGQDELTTNEGDRQAAPFTKRATSKFAQQFTDHIPELALVHPSFAELQNLFDWMVICTLIDRHRMLDRVGWSPQAFNSPDQVPYTSHPTPHGVDSVSTTNRVGRTVFGLVGGVEMHASDIIQRTSSLDDSVGRTVPRHHPNRLWND